MAYMLMREYLCRIHTGKNTQDTVQHGSAASCECTVCVANGGLSSHHRSFRLAPRVLVRGQEEEERCGCRTGNRTFYILTQTIPRNTDYCACESLRGKSGEVGKAVEWGRVHGHGRHVHTTLRPIVCAHVRSARQEDSFAPHLRFRGNGDTRAYHLRRHRRTGEMVR